MIELRGIAHEEEQIALHGHRHGEIVDILFLLCLRNGLIDPIEGALGILQTKQFCQSHIGAHGKFHVAIAHLVECLQEIRLGSHPVMTVAVDICIQACRQIKIILGAISPDFIIEFAGKLNSPIHLIMTKRKESLVAQQLVIEHHIALLTQILLVLFSISEEFFLVITLEQITEFVIHRTILASQVRNGLVCESYTRRRNGQKYDESMS